MSLPTRDRSLMVCFALTILVSAFLVFQVQPVISKFILPWFGGSPAVWTTCLLFFQVVLFAGYAYAHAATRYLRPTTQGIIHIALIMVALFVLPITPSATWKPTDASDPTWRILTLLAANVGIPYFLLSTTGPLIQAWFARSTGGANPYRLYALSNIGSLVALVSYPFVVEPLLGSNWQGRIWSVGFSLFALLCGYCAWRIWQLRQLECLAPLAAASTDERPTWGARLTWLLYAAVPSIMLLAMTNHVCQDVAAIPFLWVLPLGLYLVSFIICFEKEHWYSPRWCGPATALAVLAVCGVMVFNQMLHLWLEVGVYMLALFLICILCHGELVRRKPTVHYLTSFYLMTSAGGALGGIAVALVAPLLFTGYFELNLGLTVCYALALIASAAGFGKQVWRPASRWALASGAAAFLGLLFVVRAQASAVAIDMLAVTRDFYGVICVDEYDRHDPVEHRRFMRHGRILHGMQYLSSERELEPTIYYTESTGVGRAIRTLQEQKPSIRVGIVGLGTGTLATYGRPGDVFRYYEISPEVLRLAQKYFTYLDKSQATIECELGDARLSLEREAPQQFDLLVLDAFSGDAIPAHLLTVESLAIYQRHLSPDGMLAVHISNHHVDLTPVIHGLAQSGGFTGRRLETLDRRFKSAESAAIWAVLARDPKCLAAPRLSEVGTPLEGRSIVWTDEHSNLFEILH